MGLLSRLLTGHRQRRARRPGRVVKQATIPKKASKEGRRARRPAASAGYSIERTLTTSWRSGRKRRKITKVWRHGTCPVKHKSAAAAARCRNR